MKHENMFKKFLIKFCKAQEGIIAITFVLFMSVFIALLALPLDLGRAMMISALASSASDAAAIASAIESGDENEALEYFTANFENGDYGSKIDPNDIDIQVNQSAAVSVTPKNISINAYFLPASASSSGAAGITNNMTVATTATVGIPNSEITPSDLIIVVDSSGSMGGSNAQALKAALGQLFRDIDAHNQKLPQDDLHQVSLGSYATSVTKPNTPLTSAVLSYIPQLGQFIKPKGNTCPACGLATAVPIAVGSNRQSKIAVLMTDGYFNTTTGNNPGMNPGTEAVHYCQKIKDEGFSMWTVSYGINNSSAMTQCASSPNQAVSAKSTAQLVAFFKGIGTLVGKVRVLE